MTEITTLFSLFTVCWENLQHACFVLKPSDFHQLALLYILKANESYDVNHNLTL